RYVFNVGAEEPPRLQGTINLVNIGTLASPIGQMYMVPEVTIKNTGAPSIADEFSLLVHMPGGVIKSGRVFTITEDNPFPINYPNGQMEEIIPSQQLDIRALQPIPKNGLVRGANLFLFPDLTEDQFRNAVGATLELTFADVRGTRLSAVVTSQG